MQTTLQSGAGGRQETRRTTASYPLPQCSKIYERLVLVLP